MSLTLKDISFSYDNPTKEFKVGRNDAYGTKESLDFTTDCLSSDGNTIIIVSATGYEDLIFTVGKDGNLTYRIRIPSQGTGLPAVPWTFPLLSPGKSLFCGHSSP